MTLKNHIKNHFFMYLLIVATLLTVTFSYSRFLVKNDYIVFYEGDCDPLENSCFIGCNDENCFDEYYYSKVEKNAHDVFAQCGNSIVDCKAATKCLPSDADCSIEYCKEDGTEPCKKIILPETDFQDLDNQSNPSL